MPQTGCVPGLLLWALGRLEISLLDYIGVCLGMELFIIWIRAQYVGRTLGKRHMGAWVRCWRDRPPAK